MLVCIKKDNNKETIVNQTCNYYLGNYGPSCHKQRYKDIHIE